jgi:hypothetical protein
MVGYGLVQIDTDANKPVRYKAQLLFGGGDGVAAVRTLVTGGAIGNRHRCVRM